MYYLSALFHLLPLPQPLLNGLVLRVEHLMLHVRLSFFQELSLLNDVQLEKLSAMTDDQMVSYFDFLADFTDLR